MSSKKNTIRDEAEKLYKKGYKLIDIAKELGVSDGTIRSWKNRYKWGLNNATLQKEKNKKCNVAERKKKINNNDKEPSAEEVKEVLNNTELSDKQRLFCIYYIKCFNATKAYQKSYKCSYETAMVNGFNLLRNTKVKEEIHRLKQHKLNKAMISEEDIFQRYIDIAFSDIGDYLEWGQEEIPVIGAFGPLKDEEGNELMKLVNVVKFKECSNVDSTIISEVKQGKEGVSIKLQDKMKALQWLSDRMDLLPKDTKIKLELEKGKLELMKLKVGDNEEEQIEDDGFIAALENSVDEVWSNEEDSE